MAPIMAGRAMEATVIRSVDVSHDAVVDALTMPSTRPTVLIADDHPIYREGLTRAVAQRPDLELVGEAQDGRAALQQIRSLCPSVALLDVRMPELDGLQVLNA
ncbi:MAG TPA: response regulator transcription factor, partial [Solirubrobacteraceae bacterium]|nr:response regulator transcription factor [Solirubrobacteraceae bacterium]